MAGLLKKPKTESKIPRVVNSAPIGKRISRCIKAPLPKCYIQQYGSDQNHNTENCGFLVPGKMRLVRTFGKGIDEPNQTRLVRTFRQQADHDGDRETSTPRENCGPEILRHLARIGLQDRQPASLYPH